MLDFDQGSPLQNFFRELTPWSPWGKQRELDDGHGYKIEAYSGVYMLAHFPGTAPAGPADYLEDAIIYVGEGSWLRRRWELFEASARHGLPGHSGGHAYRDRFGTARWNELHVAALPIWSATSGSRGAPRTGRKRSASSSSGASSGS